VIDGQSRKPVLASGRLLVLPPVEPARRTFIRGDADGSGSLDLNDAIVTLAFLFRGTPVNACADALDADDSGALDLSDAIRVLVYLFQGGVWIPLPFPGPGLDPTEDSLPACTR
jgi:hypothetical protein